MTKRPKRSWTHVPFSAMPPPRQGCVRGRGSTVLVPSLRGGRKLPLPVLAPRPLCQYLARNDLGGGNQSEAMARRRPIARDGEKKESTSLHHTVSSKRELGGHPLFPFKVWRTMFGRRSEKVTIGTTFAAQLSSALNFQQDAFL